METLGYLSILLAGMSLGLIGGGGSILTVPILVYFFSIDPEPATGYSLLIVGISAALGAASYARNSQLQIGSGLTFGIPSVIGVSVSRAWPVPSLPNPVFEIGGHSISKGSFLMIAFSVFMLVASLSMLKSNSKTNGMSNDIESARRNFIFIGALGFLVGCVTGFLGAGGGFLIVPVLALLLKLPMKSAVGTSLFIIAIGSLTGFLVDVSRQGLSQGEFLASICLISSVGTGIGIWLGKFATDNLLKKGFGFLVLGIGGLIFLEQLRQLFYGPVN